MLSCSLHNLDSIGYNSLISTLNYNLFEALDLWLPKLQNLACYRNSWEFIPILSLKRRNYATKDLKSRTSKILSFPLNHHRNSWKKLQEAFFSLFQQGNVLKNFVMLRIASILSIGYENWLKKKGFLQKKSYTPKIWSLHIILRLK